RTEIMPAHFQDTAGRTLFLRGVNLADAKIPAGQPTHLLSSLSTDPQSCSRVSYVNVPFGLQDTPAHLARLRSLGFNALRVPVVWEALEHGGPGVYDDEYITYIKSFVQLCNDYGFRVIINPHQDLWSRFTGGSGAPLWTLHACGLNPDHFADTHASIRYAEWPRDGDPSDSGGRGKEKDPKSMPPMMWTSNHNRLAPSTLFALFWAGRNLAPKCIIDGVNIQDYLQDHYFAAYGRLVAALGDLAYAFDSMNEPESGLLEWQDLEKNEREASAMMGTAPTPIQAMRLGMGMDQTVDVYRLGKTGPHKEGSTTVRPGRGCWLEKEDARWGWNRSESWPMGTCVWALHNVWDLKTGELKQRDYFVRQDHGPNTEAQGTAPDCSKDASDWKSTSWKAFFDHWVSTIRKHSQRSIIFFQPPAFEMPPAALMSPSTDFSLLGYSPHFYDGLTIMKGHWHKHWNVDVLRLLRGQQDITTKLKAFKVGPTNVRQVISDQLGAMGKDIIPRGTNVPSTSQERLVPVLIGETGIPFNLDDSKAYTDGDHTSHVAALDAILSGCDEHLLNYTLWDYSATNNHEWGDHWNGEDLSIYCSETGSFPDHQYL
ncbi:family 5 glycoside hydrolase, partial [Cryphonectria parasitica EP155]